MNRAAGKILIWSVVLVASVSLFAWMFLGNFRLPFSLPFDFGSNGGGSRELSTVKEEQVASDPETLNITWYSGEVRLLSGGDHIRVVQKGTSSLRQEDAFELEESDGGRTLTVKDRRRSTFSFLGFGMGRSDLEITLPEKQYRSLTAELTSADLSADALQADSVRIKSASGDLSVTGRFGEAVLATTSGDIRVLNVACTGSLTAGSTSGDIRAAGLSCGALDLASTSGDISLSGRAESVTAASTSGDVNLDGMQASSGIQVGTASGDIRGNGVDCSLLTVSSTSGDIRMEGRFTGIQLGTTSGDASLTTSAALESLSSDSVSGTVTVSMPDNGGFDLSFQKVSGRFHCDFPTTESGGRYRYQNGGASFSAHTVSGDFYLRRNG